MASLNDLTIKITNADAVNRLARAAELVTQAAKDLDWHDGLREAAAILADLPDMLTVRTGSQRDESQETD